MMRAVLLSIAAFGGAAVLSLSPITAADAQMTAAPAVATQGDWTLGQREDWLGAQLKDSVASGALDKAGFNQAQLEMDHLRQEESRMRHDGGGQLTDNQTSELEARLDTMSDKIHWANMGAYKRPW
jgi:hypothetical protein